MPEYPYVCASCGSQMNEMRAVVDRDDCPRCSVCGGVTYRKLHAQFQVQTNQMQYSDLWRRRESDKEWAAIQREGEARYEATWEKPTPTVAEQENMRDRKCSRQKGGP